MGTWNLPDIYARALRPVALGFGHIYQANPSCPCYNYYIYIHIHGITLAAAGFYICIIISTCHWKEQFEQEGFGNSLSCNLPKSPVFCLFKISYYPYT